MGGNEAWLQIRTRLDGGPWVFSPFGICFSDTNCKATEKGARIWGSFVSAPIFISLFMCIFLATSYDAKSVFSNHCGLQRWLPTLSSVIAPRAAAWAWEWGVSFTCMGRLIFFSHSILPGRFLKERILFLLLYIGSLLGLTFFDSITSGSAHQYFFIVWLIAGVTYFLLTLSAADRPQLSLLRRLLYFYITAVCLAVVSYLLHDLFCVPYALTCFALCEYSIVAVNVFMHNYLCIWNFATLETRWWNKLVFQY